MSVKEVLKVLEGFHPDVVCATCGKLVEIERATTCSICKVKIVSKSHIEAMENALMHFRRENGMK